MRMKKRHSSNKIQIKTTYLSHSYYNKEIIGNESNHMIKKLSARSKSIKYHQTAGGTAI